MGRRQLERISRNSLMRVVADGAIGKQGTAAGRLVPVVMVDMSDHPDVAELVRVHQYLGPGTAIHSGLRAATAYFSACDSNDPLNSRLPRRLPCPKRQDWLIRSCLPAQYICSTAWRGTACQQRCIIRACSSSFLPLALRNSGKASSSPL